MSVLKTFILILFCKSGIAQQCSCTQSPELKEIISCKTIRLKNNAKIYRQYNCDSSWLVFKSLKGQQKILYHLEGMIELTERLGYSYATEYKTTFLIQNNVISGCCDPAEFILFDKETGIEKLNLGRVVFYSEIAKHPVVAYFENSNYTSFDADKINLDHIMLTNIDNGKSYPIKIPAGRLKTTIQLTGEHFPEHLVDEAKITGNILIITYRFKIKGDKDDWSTETIKIDLAKYGS